MSYKNQIAEIISHLNCLQEALDNQAWDYQDILNTILNRLARPSNGARICITGVGKNASLAMKASESFASLGIPSLYLNTCHLAHGDFGFVGPNDVVIHLSRSGKTEEMLGSAAHLRKIRSNVVQILLTCRGIGEFKDSKLHENFDKIFYTGEAFEIDEHKLAPTTSTTILLVLLDLIGTEISKRRNFSRRDFLTLHPGGSLGEMLRKESV